MPLYEHSKIQPQKPKKSRIVYPSLCEKKDICDFKQLGYLTSVPSSTRASQDSSVLMKTQPIKNFHKFKQFQDYYYLDKQAEEVDSQFKDQANEYEQHRNRAIKKKLENSLYNQNRQHRLNQMRQNNESKEADYYDILRKKAWEKRRKEQQAQMAKQLKKKFEDMQKEKEF